MTSTQCEALGGAWDGLVAELSRRAGIDLSDYKPDQVQRRLRGLMLRTGAAGLAELLRPATGASDVDRQLRRCVSVPVSEFFRNPAQFERLRVAILPRLLQSGRLLRVWSAGCSYGPEPYSLALLLEKLSPGRPHYVLATDVDELALARAQAADSFSEQDLRHVGPEFRQYFSPAQRPGRYALARTLGARVVFRQHDLLSGPPEHEFDLILCRHVMIYLTAPAKARLFRALYNALRPSGYLFVGGADVVNQLSETGFVQEEVGFYRKCLGEEIGG